MAYLRERGFSDGELYATAYGIDGKRDSTRCDLVKQVQKLLFCENLYFNPVLSFSNFSKVALNVRPLAVSGFTQWKAYGMKEQAELCRPPKTMWNTGQSNRECCP